MSDKKDVFISYKSEEFEEADWVKTVLEQNGISCWMAPECIVGGSSYASEIPQAIRNCKIFVLILSKKAQESKWVPKEIDQAINENKIILPFMLENCELKDDFNFYLTNVQRYAAYENKSNAIEKMLNEIKGVLGISAEENDGDNDADQKTAFSNKIFSDNPVSSKTKNKSKPRKKAGKKTKLIAFFIIAVLVLVPVIIFISDTAADSKVVVICGEEFKKDTISVRFEDEGKELSVIDIEAIKSLNKLASVNLDNCKLPEGSVRELMQLDLYSLSLCNCNISDSDLNNLSIGENGITSLKLNDNAITDLSVLLPLSETLDELYIDNNPISDLSNIESFNLKTLSVKNLGLSDVSEIASLIEIRELYIDSNNINSLESLAACENLRIISVNNNSISDFKGLEHSLELAEVYAESNQINSLTGLDNATVLAFVNLSNNAIQDISILAKSKETLTNLYVNNNQITDIDALKGCVNLKELYINNNLIISLEPLADCTKLEELSAENNSLVSAAGIKNSVNLKYVDLSDNSIKDSSVFNNIVQNGFDRLSLDLSNNEISSLNLPNVEYSFLNVSGNNIESISSLNGRTISKLIFSFSSAEDYSVLDENSFYHVYIVDCPLDRQLELKKVFGEYNTEFISADQIDSIEN